MKNKIIKFIKENKKWLILSACIFIFTIILEDVCDNEIIKFDTRVYELISKLKNNNITTILKLITNLGGVYILITDTIILGILIKNIKVKLAIIINIIIITIFNQLLKYIVQRPRPIENRLIRESGYSFPSGHSMVSMAFYGLIIYFCYKYIKNKSIRNICITCLGVLILLIGISRIYLGVHYASDVIAGFMISIAYLIAFITVFESIEIK